MSIQEVTLKLAQMNEIHCTLLGLAEQKKQVLINNEVNELSLLMKQEAKLVKLIAVYEQEWMDATVRFFHIKGIHPSPNITISDLAKMVNQPDVRAALVRAQTELVETIHKLKKANQFNQELIQQSLAFIDYSLDLVTGSYEQEAVYHNPSQHGNEKMRIGSFDYRG